MAIKLRGKTKTKRVGVHMAYAYKRGKETPKSKAFTKILDGKIKYVEKGSILTIDNQRCQVTAIRKIEVGNGILKVSGKCVPVL